MWAQYRKSLVINQLFIAAICVLAVWWLKSDLFFVLLVFVSMQFGALIGAWFGARLKRKMEAAEKKLPLEGP